MQPSRWLMIAAVAAAGVVGFRADDARAADAVQDFIFLIDTSGSMQEGGRLAPLRVTLNDYASTVPVDGSARIGIYFFDRGLRSQFFSRVLKSAADLQDAKVFLSAVEAKGSSTTIYDAFDGVMSRIDADLKDGQSHDYSVHLFTDGADTGSKKTFTQNITRFSALRNTLNQKFEFYFHALDVTIPETKRKQIRETAGMVFVPGLGMPPKARFVPSRGEVSDNTPVTFVNKTIGKAEKWTWDFGDGAASAEESPTHVFKRAGKFVVQLSAANPSGSTFARMEVVVQGSPPQAVFLLRDPDAEKIAGHAVIFQDRSVGRVDSWAWDFGDATGRSIEASPQYVYRRAGTYTATLLVKGPYGQSSTSRVVKILPPPRPEAHFTVPVATLDIGQEFKLSDQSRGVIERWAWEMGDGTKITTRDATHRYTTAGEYTITLAVSGPGGTDATTSSISVRKVQLAFATRPVEPRHGALVVFVNDSQGKFSDWNWSFGDGITSSEKNPEHVFAKPGTYTVKLSASGPDGKVQSVERGLRVVSSDVPPKAQFVLPVSTIDLNKPITLTHTSSGTITGIRWDMGDGRTFQGSSPVVAYNKPGEYRITLTVTNSTASDSSSQTLKVGPQYEQPKLGFRFASGILARGEHPLEIRIENQSTGSIQSYTWDFGDGTTNDDINPSHVYRQKGEYKIKLSVMDRQGQRFDSTSSQTLSVSVLPPRVFLPLYQAVVAVVLYVGCLAFLRSRPRGTRYFRYEINNGGKETHSDSSRDKKFLWLDGAKVPEDAPRFSDGFEVRMTKDWLLRRRYQLAILNGRISAQKKNGKPLDGDTIVRGCSVKVRDRDEVRFTVLNDDLLTGLRAQSFFVIPILALLFIGIKYLP